MNEYEIALKALRKMRANVAERLDDRELLADKVLAERTKQSLIQAERLIKKIRFDYENCIA